MKKIFPLLFILLSHQTGITQNIPGTTVTIQSSVLNESRKIQIFSPATSVEKSSNFPVLYVFDAGSLFLPVVSATQFMNHSSYLPQMPEAIVVGIYNTKRDRDMPTPQEINKTKGAADFLQFIIKELEPYIKNNYPTNGLNILAGHSQAGLFVTYAGFAQPQLFPFVLALDAPMTINPSLFKEYQQKLIKNCSLHYFSAETLYGWGKSFIPPADCNNFRQHKIEGETHETMPYKGIYDGLQFLFREYVPLQTGMSLQALETYYKTLSAKHHCKYDIPAAVLLASARQHISVFKKQGALDIIGYYKKIYGNSEQANTLLANANAITRETDHRVDYYLNHPGSTADALQPFMGKWEGTLFVPGGQNINVSWEIKTVDGKSMMHTRVMDEFNMRSDFLLLTENGELAWGRKHNSGGIYLSIGKISADGKEITGTEDLIGVDFPKDVTPFKANTFKFTRVE